MPCLKRPLEWPGVWLARRLLWLWLWLGCVLCLGAAPAWAAADNAAHAPEAATPALTLEHQDGDLVLSAQFGFELPEIVQAALLKGIPIYFVAQADVLRERWYWRDRRVASAQRSLRLAYHPLTQRWRLSLGSGDLSEATQGLTLSQTYDTLADVMAAVRRISHWKIATAQDTQASGSYYVEFSFALDTARLPRPLQIGTLGQSDWTITVRLRQPLALEPKP